MCQSTQHVYSANRTVYSSFGVNAPITQHILSFTPHSELTHTRIFYFNSKTFDTCQTGSTCAKTQFSLFSTLVHSKMDKDYYIIRVKCRDKFAFIKLSDSELDKDTFLQKGKYKVAFFPFIFLTTVLFCSHPVVWYQGTY